MSYHDEWPFDEPLINICTDKQMNDAVFNKYHDNALDEMMSLNRDADRFEQLKSEGKSVISDEERHEAHKAYIDQQMAKNRALRPMVKLDNGLTYEEQQEVLRRIAEASDRISQKAENFYSGMIGEAKEEELRIEKAREKLRIAKICGKISRKAKAFYETDQRVIDLRRKLHEAAADAVIHTGESMNLEEANANTGVPWQHQEAILGDKETFQAHLKELANLYNKR